VIAPLWLTTSLAGHRALVVPLAHCGECRQDMPVDHDCPTVRELVQLAANTIHPGPDALQVIRARTSGTAPDAAEAAPDDERTTS
jgi:hypothetical protein